MDIESIKEQALDRFFEIKNKVQDSELYIRAKQGYDDLSPEIQKVVKYAAIVLAVYSVYLIPASYVASAEEKMTYFEGNRQLTRELIRAGRIARTVQMPPVAPSPASLSSQVDAKLKQARVLPEQKANVQPVDKVASNKIVPSSIQQSGVKATVQSLNLRQVIEIGESLNEISGSKLMNLAIQADQKDPHYFHVDYEIAAFSVPQAEPPPETKKKGSRSKSPQKKKGTE